jgi:hypothetical protein
LTHGDGWHEVPEAATAARISSLPYERRSKDPLRPKAQSDRDAELDQALRELGDELLMQEIPERLLRALRDAAGNQGPGDRDKDRAPARRGRPRS